MGTARASDRFLQATPANAERLKNLECKEATRPLMLLTSLPKDQIPVVLLVLIDSR